MKLNRIKAVLSEKGISQTWLAKKLDKIEVKYKKLIEAQSALNKVVSAQLK